MNYKAWCLAFLCAGTSLFAQASMTLTGAGSNVLGGIYMGPYTALINGVSTDVICDDFLADSYLDESWSANVSTIANLTSAKFAGVAGAQQKYNAVAWLSLQLLNPPSSCAGANCAGDIQYAIWQVFDSSPFSRLSGQDLTNAQNWLTLALNQTYAPDAFSNVSIYTPISGDPAFPITCSGGPCATSPPQEFIVVKTPESPSLALLGVDFSGVGVLVFFLRRRLSRPA